jgi:N-acetylglucosaminyldiphosphoundecaprenol N-acetyl-beta-D-mannosaminyltransferase
MFGVPVDLLTMDETVVRCRELVAAGIPAQHVALNAGKVVLLRRDPQLREIVARCDLVSADGQSVVWAGSILGIRVPERVAGIDLMERLLQESERARWPVYFLGARPDVLAAFEAEVVRRHPRIVVAGRRNGYFDDEDEVVDSIRGSGARLLFVGMPSPRKERFLAAHLGTMGPLFAMGVGGSFDVWAGRTRRAPSWLQRAGLEWLFRLAQEPRRMWKRYLLGNLRFAGIVIGERLRDRRGGPSHPPR